MLDKTATDPTSMIPNDSVGLVTPKILAFDEPLTLRCGRVIPKYEITYETYGELNAQRSNGILICHALSGDHHAAGYHHENDRKPGWWDNCIGPGKPIDTNDFFVVCLNNLGGCSGSTGPSSINPETDSPYGPDFPIVTVPDWVKSQARLSDALGIEQWAAVVGGSLGGMQALTWAKDYPHRLRHAFVIAAAPKLSAQNIAFNEVARQAIVKDPEFFQGHYSEKETLPRHGLSIARMVGHITYLSDDSMGDKFGRELQNDRLNYDFSPEFQVESYLRYKGEQFSERFDANTYLLMTKALDYFDPASEFNGSLVKALSQAQCKFLVISFTSDWRFSPERSEEIVNALIEADKNVSYARIDAPQGHDSFLMPNKRYMDVLTAYIKNIKSELKDLQELQSQKLKHNMPQSDSQFDLQQRGGS